ncbi:MAG: FkbM family methyltransferase [Chlamydiia bacterium]|nr:FkbM family methyltransferase [Chlamydiia bacterium]
MEVFKMHCDNELEKWRSETFWHKEPETIAWINSFKPESVFFDIGANIGIYTLYAAVKKHTVISFEPMRNNFIRLVENIILNKFDNVIPLPVVVSNGYGKIEFSYNDDRVGASGGQAGDIDGWYKYITHSVTLDDFMSYNPNYIKIDVDGQELRIIKGMEHILYMKMIDSCLVEIEGKKDKKAIRKIFEKYGYTADNEFNKLKYHSRNRRGSKGPENMVFTRE